MRKLRPRGYKCHAWGHTVRKQWNLPQTLVSQTLRPVLLATMLLPFIPWLSGNLCGQVTWFYHVTSLGPQSKLDVSLLSSQIGDGALWSLKFKVKGSGSGFSFINCKVLGERIEYSKNRCLNICLCLRKYPFNSLSRNLSWSVYLSFSFSVCVYPSFLHISTIKKWQLS